MKKLKYYINSFRLRTLPLSISGILLGSLLALSAGMFSLPTFLWALLTTLCLQILSNLANELGDQQKGTDISFLIYSFVCIFIRYRTLINFPNIKRIYFSAV